AERGAEPLGPPARDGTAAFRRAGRTPRSQRPALLPADARVAGRIPCGRLRRDGAGSVVPATDGPAVAAGRAALADRPRQCRAVPARAARARAAERRTG